MSNQDGPITLDDIIAQQYARAEGDNSGNSAGGDEPDTSDAGKDLDTFSPPVTFEGTQAVEQFGLDPIQAQLLNSFIARSGGDPVHANVSGGRVYHSSGRDGGSFNLGKQWSSDKALIPTQADGQAIIDCANRMGVKPQDLIAIFAQESGGNPNRWGGDGGSYCGLIQFSPECQQKYGITGHMTIAEQLPAVERYFRDRFKAAGMELRGATLAQLYSSVLAGSPAEKYQHRTDSNGTSAASSAAEGGSLAQHFAQLMRTEKWKDMFSSAPAESGAGLKSLTQLKIEAAAASVSHEASPAPVKIGNDNKAGSAPFKPAAAAAAPSTL